MLVLILLLILAIYILWKKPEDSSKNALPENISQKIDKLWRGAQEAIIDKKFLRAEKFLLTILRFDGLVIVAAGQKNFPEAIECFEIAQSLESSTSNLHNVGLIYLETQDYQKAALAFEQALELENNLPARYIAYAKALENLGKDKAAIDALEKAVEIDNRPQTLRTLGALYLKAGQTEKAKEIKEKLDEVKAGRKTIRQNRLENAPTKKI